MEFNTAKNVFAVGLILSLAIFDAIIPGLSIVGWILVLIGLHSLSQHFNRPDIFRNMLYAVIIAIVGTVSAIWIVVLAFAFFARKVYMSLSEVSGVDALKTAAKLIWIGAFLAVILVGYIVIFIGQIFAIIGAFELKPPAPSSSGQQPPSLSP